MQGASENQKELVRAAEEYCRLIDTVDYIDGRLLDQFARLLPRIHAAVVALDEGTRRTALPSGVPRIDFDKRFDLFSRLRQLLGDHDSYRLDYDATQGEEAISGSLADDFTDIYFELKSGLELLQNEPEALDLAADFWCGSYFWHWGQHLVDAERHLYNLQVHRHLPVKRVYA